MNTKRPFPFPNGPRKLHLCKCVPLPDRIHAFSRMWCSVRSPEVQRPKAIKNGHEKTTSEKLFRLTSFSATNLEKCRKLAPKLSKGLPNDVKMSPETGFSCFGGHLHFERPYKVLAHNSCLQGVKVDTEVRKTSAEKGSQKNHSNACPDQLF